MDWSFGRNSSVRRLLPRHEHNRLMLEQYLSGLEARYIVLAGSATAAQAEALAKVRDVVDRYRAFCATEAKQVPPNPLPDWNEAFMAELVLDQLLPGEAARGELVLQLAALKSLDPSIHEALSAEWTAVNSGGNVPTDDRIRALLVNARQANQWEGTERWIIRSLGLSYATRLGCAFLAALVLGIGLAIAESTVGSSIGKAGVSGLGFAAAAGLLGASFSAMVGQARVFELHNVEEARAATSLQMIWLRLGVGVAAALIIYFFFQSGLVKGVLFPDLQQIGFGRVVPLGDEIAKLRANAQSLEASSSAIMETIKAVNDRIAQVDAFPGAVEQLKDKLQETGGALAGISRQIGDLQSEWASGNRALGTLAPNPDLSKLVVWCFAAGFTQTLVPSLLAKVTPQEAPK